MARKRYSEEFLLATGRELFAEHGSGLTQWEFCREAGVSSIVIRDRFGGWLAFRERLGLPPQRWRSSAGRRHSRGEIIEQLRQAALTKGVDITLEEFSQETGISTATVYRYFQGWPHLRDCADLPTHGQPKKRYSDEALLKDLHKVAKLCGRAPTQEDFRLYGHAAVSTVVKRFGSGWEDVRFKYEKWVEYRVAFGVES